MAGLLGAGAHALNSQLPGQVNAKVTKRLEGGAVR